MWSRLKHGSGIYFITREKANSAATVMSENLMEKSDPRNQGMKSDQLIGASNSETMRRITNELTLPAYQLVCCFYGFRKGSEMSLLQFISGAKLVKRRFDVFPRGQRQRPGESCESKRAQQSLGH